MSLRSFVEDYRHVSNTHDRVATRAVKFGAFVSSVSLMAGLGIGARTAHDSIDHKPIKEDVECLVGDLVIGALGAGVTRHIVNAEMWVDSVKPEINHGPDWEPDHS